MKYDDKPWVKSYDEGVKSEIEISELNILELQEGVQRDFPDSYMIQDVRWRCLYTEM